MKPKPIYKFHNRWISIGAGVLTGMLLMAGLQLDLPAQGFEPTTVTFPVPSDGAMDNGVPIGFSTLQNYSSGGTGTHHWDTRDMTGDGLPDLVVTHVEAQFFGTVFGGVKNPHWIVHTGNGTGFNTTPIKWNLPSGGFKSLVMHIGFHYLSSESIFWFPDVGTQNWNTRDMNADGKPDLVVTSEIVDATRYSFVFRNGLQAYWKVYLNNGSGFSDVPIQWNVPEGGATEGVTHVGFHLDEKTTGMGSTGGYHHSWALRDLDGDRDVDLVVMANNGQGLGVGSQPHWLMYRNTGSGFELTPETWTLPAGGRILSGGLHLGFTEMTESMDVPDGIGGQLWDVQDIDNDARPDLIVTTERLPSLYLEYPVFGMDTNAHWRVFHNNGLGFDTTYMEWKVPNFGGEYDGLFNGFCRVKSRRSALASTGSEDWDFLDINGDGFPDLVVTGKMNSFGPGVFGFNDNPYWKVYLNQGNGFDSLAFHWRIPFGGQITNGMQRGYFYTDGIAYKSNEWDLGSRSWGLMDLNGDRRPDFVSTGTKSLEGTDAIAFELYNNNPHWKVNWNTSAALGETELPTAVSIQVFPNPAAGVLNIASGENAGKLRILDIEGKQMYAGELQRGRLESLSVGNWSRGVYFVELTSTKGKSVKKVVLN